MSFRYARVPRMCDGVALVLPAWYTTQALVWEKPPVIVVLHVQAYTKLFRRFLGTDLWSAHFDMHYSTLYQPS